MIKSPRIRSTAVVVALALTGVLFQACASAPRAPAPAAKPPSPQVAAPQSTQRPASPRPSDGKMAPIPNPSDATQPAAPVTRPSARPAAPKASPAKPATPAPTGASTDSARAAKLRAQGLEQLNRGAIDKAVSLLQQAQALDPSNALIQRDLDRALRISQAVRAKP
jgi:hypothetical protein